MRTKKEEDNKPKPKGQVNTLPDGSIIDFSTLGVDDLKLTDREKRFVFWYCYPGTDAFQNQTRAAVRAGYKKDKAYMIGFQVKNKPNIVTAIKRVLDSKLKADLEEEFHKIIEIKKRRVHFDLADYVYKHEKDIPIDKEGHTISVIVEDLKDLADLAPELRMAIDGIDYKGPQAVKTYIMADREKAMNDLLNLYHKLHGPIDENAYDVEATAEIVQGPQERLTLKVTARKKKEEIAENADYLNIPGNEQTLEEL
jgi:hypothetical protein